MSFISKSSPSHNTNAALSYAKRGWPVYPVRGKAPLTEHGFKDATTDEAQIRSWWRRWPDALVSIATGEISGVVALDIDIREDGSGFDTLEELGHILPTTPIAHTPSGGVHYLFAWPGYRVKSLCKGEIGRHLDVRADRAGLILPPGRGRRWDEHCGPDTPLAPMPLWLIPPEPKKEPETPRPRPKGRLSRYGEAALDKAVVAIVDAVPGTQHATLNREVFSIAGLVATGAIPADLALDALGWAARKMPSFDPRRPWRAAEIDRHIKSAFLDGLRHPREARR